MFVYRNATSGQTIESEQPLAHLDGLARWVRTEQADKPRPEPSESEKPAPRRRPRKATE